MKNKQIMKKMYAVLFVVSLLVGIVAETDVLNAATYVRLVEKSATLNIREGETQTIYETTTVKVKALRGVKVKKVTYASQNKKIAVVSAKGKVQARGKGNTRIIATVNYKRSGKIQSKKLSFSVKVEEKDGTGQVDDPDMEEGPDDEEAVEEPDIVTPVTPVHTIAPVTNRPSTISSTVAPVQTTVSVKTPAVTIAPVKVAAATAAPKPAQTKKPAVTPPAPKSTTKPAYATISNGTYKINSKVKSGMMLDVAGNATKNGTNIQIYQGNDSTAQKFKIQLTGDGWYRISNPLTGKCLDVKDGSTKSRANVQLYTYNGTDAQKWRFYLSGDGEYFVIKNKLGYYLDVDGARAENGTNVMVYTKNGTNAQKWKLVETSAIIVNPASLTLDGIGKAKSLSVSYEPADTFAANRTLT